MENKMKDSGIDFIGLIPNDWEITKIKKKYNFQTGFTPDTNNENYYDLENGVDWITIGDLNDNKIIPDKTKSKISKYYLDTFKPKMIPKGSLLYSFKLSVGQVAFTDRDLYSNEAIAAFIDSQDVCLPFLYYASLLIEENAKENIYGAKLLNRHIINNSYITSPPLNEQNLIAQYLDEKVPQIEKVIDVIKKEIEVLEMTKKSIITECITKGLDKDVELKDSDVENLGLINKTYEIKKIKYVSILKTGTTPEQKIGISDEKTINNIKWHTPGDFNGFELNVSQYIDNNNNLFFPENSIYLVTIGATLGKIAIESEKSYCNQQITVLMPKINNKYLMYNLYSNVDYLRMNSESTTLAQLNNQTLKNIKICVASLKEQQEIVDYLDKKCGAIDKIIATKKEQISKLETHKQSLIYDYVTGKKRVKEVE